MNAFKRSLEESVDEFNDVKASVKRGVMRDNCLFVFDLTCKSKSKVQVKKVYLYKSDDTRVYVDFFNETQDKGILLDMDQWLTLQDKLGVLTSCVNTKKACSVHLSDNVHGRVSLFMKKAYLHIREYYTGGDGKDNPTATGIAMSSLELAKFVDHMTKLKESLGILHTLPNVIIGEDTYTVILENEEGNVFYYMLLEKGVRFTSSHKDLQKALEVYLEEKEVERVRMVKMAESKNKLADIERKKLMLVCLVEKHKREDDVLMDISQIDKMKMSEVFFRAGESLGLKTHSPIKAMQSVLVKHFQLVVELAQGKRPFPNEFIPYIESVNIVLDRIEEMAKLDFEDGTVILQPCVDGESSKALSTGFEGFDDL